MLRNNKGSILVTTLMIFSVISTICIACIGIIYSNNNFYNLEYNLIKYKELSLSGIEIVRSNIIDEVKEAIKNTTKKSEFMDYFLGNNTHRFINKIRDISKSDLENVSIRIQRDLIYEDKGVLKFELISKYKDSIYTKTIQVSVKIENPWNDLSDDNQDKVDEEKNEQLVIDKNEEYIDKDIKDEVDQNIEDVKGSIKEKDLVTIYNYREI